MREPKRYQMKAAKMVELIAKFDVHPVEAMQLTGDGHSDIDVYRWVEEAVGGLGPVEILSQDVGVSIDPSTGFMMIAAKKGLIYVAIPDDWVIRDANGDFGKVSPDEFASSYEIIE